MNNHVWLGGVAWKLASNERKVVPLVQPLVGDTRNSYAGTIQHSFTFQLAGDQAEGTSIARTCACRVRPAYIRPEHLSTVSLRPRACSFRSANRFADEVYSPEVAAANVSESWSPRSVAEKSFAPITSSQCNTYRNLVISRVAACWLPANRSGCFLRNRHRSRCPGEFACALPRRRGRFASRRATIPHIDRAHA